MASTQNIVEEVQRMLDTYDTNKDGEITKAEAVEYFKGKKAFNPERSAIYLFQVYDKDNDGKITIKELAGDIDFDKALKEYKEKQAKSKQQEAEVEEDIEAFILRHNKDDNTDITKDELIQGFKETGAKDPEKSANFILTEIDENKDGTITVKELRVGCRRNSISISIGNLTTHTEFYYELPIISSCSIDNDQIVLCFGNFTNYIYFYENGKINILFSSSTDEIYLPIKSTDFKIDSFSFQLNKNYKTNQVYLNVCNELLPIINIEYNSTIQTHQPTTTIINTLKPQLNSSEEQETKQNITNTNSYSSNEKISNKQKNEKIPNEGFMILILTMYW
ncbi:hypothetical protein ACTFIW_003143 [Dictyostelium discoideum]